MTWTRRRKFGQRIYDFVFGYDYFVSHRHHDAHPYAEKLVAQLEPDLRCFLDSRDFAKGLHWTVEGKRALAKTKILIVVLSPGVFDSEPVFEEVQFFQNRKPENRIIVIDIGGIFTSAPPGQRLIQTIGATRLRIKESSSALQAGPSEEIGKLLRDDFDLERQNTRRSRILGTTVTVLSGLLLGLIVVAAIAAIYMRKEERAQQESVRNLSRGYANLARLYFEKQPLPDNSLGLAALCAALRVKPDDAETAAELRNVLQEKAWFIPVGPEVAYNENYGDHGPVLSPDGKMIVGRYNRWLRISNAQTGETEEDLVLFDDLQDYLLTSDGRWLIVLTRSLGIRIWDMKNRKSEPANLCPETGLTMMDVSPDGRRCAVALPNGDLRIYEVPSRTQVGEPLRHGVRLRQLKFCRESNRLLTMTEDRIPRVIDGETGRWIWRLPEGKAAIEIAAMDGHGECVIAASKHPDGKQYIAGPEANGRWILEKWGVNEGVVECTTQDYRGPIKTLLLDDSRRNIVTCDYDAIIRTFQTYLNDLPGLAAADLGAARLLSIHDEELLVTYVEGSAVLWRIPELQSGWSRIAEPLTHRTEGIQAARFTGNGKWVIATTNNSARVWRLRAAARIEDPPASAFEKERVPEWFLNYVEAIYGWSMDSDRPARGPRERPTGRGVPESPEAILKEAGANPESAIYLQFAQRFSAGETVVEKNRPIEESPGR